MERMFVGSLILIAILGLESCASSGVEHPQSAVSAYCDAVRAKDAAAVYALLDEDARLGMQWPEFALWFDKNHALILEQAEELAQSQDASSVQVKGSVPLTGGIQAEVTWHNGKWLLAREVPTHTSWGSPAEAIEAFQGSLRAQDLEGVMRMLSEERRAAYLREMDLLDLMLAEKKGQSLVVRSNTAVLHLANGDKIFLVKERGSWKIHDYQSHHP